MSASRERKKRQEYLAGGGLDRKAAREAEQKAAERRSNLFYGAIAILFAILRLRPMPFCVLDEIEAALDDANVLRFAKYLKRFSKETQFIVITHRKPTMELADALYGVTMEEKGVSKMVSVKLADAVKLAE